jgi:hypothetical protein
MGILDTILGRTKPVKANLDALFALPSAAVTLQAAAGLVPTGQAGVCFKPPAGQAFAQMQADIEQLLRTADDPTDQGGGAAAGADLQVKHVGDNFGYRWIIVEGGGIDDIVTRAHMVHSSLEDAGWSTQLLCSVFGFHPGSEPGADPDALGDSKVSQPLFIVYLAKRGTFYPFAPTGTEQRDSELELRIRGVIGSDLPMESDLSRWFPLWGLPLT